MTRMVALADETYETLEAVKKPEQSFSELIRELAEERRSRELRALVGSWKMSDAEYSEFMNGVYARRAASKTPPVKL